MAQLVKVSSPVRTVTECMSESHSRRYGRFAAYFIITVQCWQDMLVCDNGISSEGYYFLWIMFYFSQILPPLIYSA